MPEYFDIYDSRRVPVGKTVLRGTALGNDEYRIAVQVWIGNVSGQWLIVQRSPEKSCPLKWEPPGGCVLAGENSLQAAIREVYEETGIRLCESDALQFASFRRIEPCWENPGFLDVWMFASDIPSENIRLQPGETVDARWATPEEICRMYESGEFVSLSEYAGCTFLPDSPPDNFSVRIARILFMEALLDRVLASENPGSMTRELSILDAYYTSHIWMADYEADENGLLPPRLKRGVLSQDTLYDLLSEHR